MKDTFFYSKKTLSLNGNILDLRTPKVMGILNVTPDSFFDGGRYHNEVEVLKQVGKMIEAGAAIIDIGGYSSRPEAENISEAVESERIRTTLGLIGKEFPEANISIDTFRSGIAKMAVQEGAAMINDISGGTLDDKMFQTIADLQVPYVLMHMKGNPQTMIQQTEYKNLLTDVIDHLNDRLNKLLTLGVKDIIVDPGFGFAKSLDQNYELLKNLKYFKVLNHPLLVGVSRKSMIYKKLSIKPEEALNGTTALNMVSLMNGASILRVHDVKEAVEVVKLYEQLS
ncbi:dihydropteroate synthase [Fulvivirgaceae bacterium BMA10]|uniref:Dihydropteroate synthase n=1 Tax=Splendidivirga corallicola TaxID=3051826 RepID=A0ABT8KS01_9BACT|nr:dihydropteroate synthase [Fulvivirgaceae bacterium BMA10]